MRLIGPKTGGRAQRTAVFSIGPKTGDVLELTIYGSNAGDASTLHTPVGSARNPARKNRAARFQAKRPGNAAVTGLALRGVVS